MNRVDAVLCQPIPFGVGLGNDRAAEVAQVGCPTLLPPDPEFILAPGDRIHHILVEEIAPYTAHLSSCQPTHSASDGPAPAPHPVRLRWAPTTAVLAGLFSSGRCLRKLGWGKQSLRTRCAEDTQCHGE